MGFAENLGKGLSTFFTALHGNLNGQTMADRERAALENSVLRGKLNAQQQLPGLLAKQNQYMADAAGNIPEQAPASSLAGILAGQSPDGSIATNVNGPPIPSHILDTNQAEMSGVLAQMSPDIFVQQTLANQAPTRPSSDSQLIDLAVNGSPEEQELARFMIMNQDTSGMDPIDRLKLIELQGQLQDQQAERSKRIQQENAERENRISAVTGSLDSAQRLVRLNKELKGQFLEPGSAGFFGDMKNKRWAADMWRQGTKWAGYGKQSQEVQDMLTNYDSFVKGSRDFVGQALEGIQASGGTVTRARQRLMEEASAGENISPGTVNSVMVVTMEELIRQAEYLNRAEGAGIDVRPYRREWQRLKSEKPSMFNQFFSELEVNDAIEAGALGYGDVIMFNGEKIMIQPPGG